MPDEPCEAVLRLLPAHMREAIGPIPSNVLEIRLRSERPAELVCRAGGAFQGPIWDAAQVRAAANALAEHSLYAREAELSRGYFTVRGGCRVGVCGRFVETGDGHVSLGEIASINVRIAREIRGAADALMPALYDNGAPVSALILSAPGLGKTTLLRDIARSLSDGGRRVSVADERGELAACAMGVPTLDIGSRTDVLDGCPKARSIMMLIRSMSPEVIVTDELGTEADCEAVREARRCGVNIVASAHARDRKDASRRGSIARLIAESAFDRVVTLRGVGKIGEVWYQTERGEGNAP